VSGERLHAQPRLRVGPQHEEVEGPSSTFEERSDGAMNRTRVTDRHGRVWTIAGVPVEAAEEEDLRFWQLSTGEERVAAVADCSRDSLRTRGIHEIPRLQEVLAE
jgi:hypothetical protein